MAETVRKATIPHYHYPVYNFTITDSGNNSLAITVHEADLILNEATSATITAAKIILYSAILPQSDPDLLIKLESYSRAVEALLACNVCLSNKALHYNMGSVFDIAIMTMPEEDAIKTIANEKSETKSEITPTNPVVDSDFILIGPKLFMQEIDANSAAVNNVPTPNPLNVATGQTVIVTITLPKQVDRKTSTPYIFPVKWKGCLSLALNASTKVDIPPIQPKKDITDIHELV